MHGGQSVSDEFRRRCILDCVAQVVQHLLLDVGVGLEVGVRQHLRHRGGERGSGRKDDLLFIRRFLLTQDGLIGDRRLLHELVVEVEGNREPRGRRTVGQRQIGQLGHVGRLDAEGSPVVEADVRQRGYFGDRQVMLQGLDALGTPAFVVVVHFLFGCGANGVTVRGDRVIDVAIQQGGDGVLFQHVADEGIGEAVLDGAQVDVGQRRLRHGGDGAGHAGQVVGQVCVDSNIEWAGAVILLHQPQQSVSLRLVEGDVIHVRQHLVFQQDVNPGGVKFFPLIPVA